MKILNTVLFIILFSTTSFTQWERTNGPEGISINALTNVDNILYAGTETDGVYASTDEGSTWYPANNGIETESISAISSINNTLLIGIYGQGVYHSTNDGETWLPSSNYNSGLNVSAIFVKDQYVFAGTSEGLLRSSDNGVSWVELPFFNFQTASTFCITGDKLIAGCFDYSHASTDNGETWDTIESLTGASLFSLYAKGDTVYGGGRNEIFRSIDGGTTFFSIEVPFEFGVVNMYSITSIGQTLFMATSYDGVYKSTDNGLTWSPLNTGMGPKDVRALTVTQSSTLIAGSHYSGVYKSTDQGLNWNKSMTGFPAGSSILKLIKSNRGVLAGTRDGIYKTTNNGTSWEKLTGNNDTINYSDVRGLCIDNSYVYAALTYKFHGVVYISSDSGESWYRSDNGLPSDATFLWDIAKSGDNVIAATDQGLYYSTDNGQSWLPSNIPNESIINLAVTEDYVFGTLVLDDVYRSADDGVTWSIVLNSPSAYFTTLAAKDNYAYAGGFDFGAFYSTNSGNNWYVAGFPNGTSVYTISFIPAEPGMVLAGTNIEPDYIYAAFNNNPVFSPYSGGLGVKAIAEAITSNDTFMFAGTDYNGVWRRTLPGVTSVNNNDLEKPDEYSLKQNYPNPFNPSTTIEYSIPENGNVKLVVYNLLGEEVATLINKYKEAGSYKINFDAIGISSGIYFYKLNVNNFSSTKKMILLR